MGVCQPTPWGSGVLALNPLPAGDLNLGGFHAATVCALLHLNRKLLGFHVGSDKVHVVDLAKEVSKGALDVEVGGGGHRSVSVELREL